MSKRGRKTIYTGPNKNIDDMSNLAADAWNTHIPDFEYTVEEMKKIFNDIHPVMDCVAAVAPLPPEKTAAGIVAPDALKDKAAAEFIKKNGILIIAQGDKVPMNYVGKRILFNIQFSMNSQNGVCLEYGATRKHPTLDMRFTLSIVRSHYIAAIKTIEDGKDKR